MLSFIYCGQTNNLKAHAVDLLKAADHCQIDNLKGIFFTTPLPYLVFS